MLAALAIRIRGCFTKIKSERLTSHIQNVMKLNFASSLKMCIFATVNRLLGLPRESAFSLNSAIGELGHFTQYKVRIGNEFSLGLYSYFYDIHQVEKFRQPYPLYTTGSPSPTNRDRVKWMAPLSSLVLTLSEPRQKTCHYGEKRRMYSLQEGKNGRLCWRN